MNRYDVWGFSGSLRGEGKKSGRGGREEGWTTEGKSVRRTFKTMLKALFGWG